MQLDQKVVIFFYYVHATYKKSSKKKSKMNNNAITFEIHNDEKCSICMDMKAECKTVCQRKFHFN